MDKSIKFQKVDRKQFLSFCMRRLMTPLGCFKYMYKSRCTPQNVIFAWRPTACKTLYSFYYITSLSHPVSFSTTHPMYSYSQFLARLLVDVLIALCCSYFFLSLFFFSFFRVFKMIMTFMSGRATRMIVKEVRETRIGMEWLLCSLSLYSLLFLLSI